MDFIGSCEGRWQRKEVSKSNKGGAVERCSMGTRTDRRLGGWEKNIGNDKCIMRQEVGRVALQKKKKWKQEEQRGQGKLSIFRRKKIYLLQTGVFT